MALARAYAVALLGLDGHLIEVVADLAQGLPAFTITGLPDAALSEARDRVRAAVVNSRQPWPSRRITLGLSPAALRKSGSMFDLAMAAAVLAADGRVPPGALAGRVLLGELGLDGRVRAVAGVLPAVLAAVRVGRPDVIVPAGNAAEATLVPGARVTGVATLGALVALLRGEPLPDDPLPLDPPGRAARSLDRPVPDLADVAGQLQARRALEVAAAGGHHAFLTGPPGVGKTMLAERLPGLLPPLELDAALEVTAVHSLAGELPADGVLVDRPPYRAPHHTASVAALVGGGSAMARPGAVSLAHHGVLFLDEAPEFDRRALDALRQPLESGEIVLSRASGTARYPARFLLLLAANPCPCSGSAPEDAFAASCSCSPAARGRYLRRLSGPLLDRIDVKVPMAPVTRAALEAGDGEPTALVRERVLAARARCRHRLRGTPWRSMTELPGGELRRRWPLGPDALAQAMAAISLGRLNPRGLHRVIRVAWTIADLDGVARPGPLEVGEACGLRGVLVPPASGVRRSA